LTGPGVTLRNGGSHKADRVQRERPKEGGRRTKWMADNRKGSRRGIAPQKGERAIEEETSKKTNKKRLKEGKSSHTEGHGRFWGGRGNAKKITPTFSNPLVWKRPTLLPKRRDGGKSNSRLARRCPKGIPHSPRTTGGQNSKDAGKIWGNEGLNAPPPNVVLKSPL